MRISHSSSSYITLSIADQQEKASRRLAFVLIISLGDPDNQEMASKNFKDRKGCKRHTGELIDRICVDIASSGGTECIVLIHGHDRFALGHSVTPNTGKIDRTSHLQNFIFYKKKGKGIVQSPLRVTLRLSSSWKGREGTIVFRLKWGKTALASSIDLLLHDCSLSSALGSVGSLEPFLGLYCFPTMK